MMVSPQCLPNGDHTSYSPLERVTKKMNYKKKVKKNGFPWMRSRVHMTDMRLGNTYKSEPTMHTPPSHTRVPRILTITSDHGDFVDETRPKPCSIQYGGC
jgi:hypothetical protein